MAKKKLGALEFELTFSPYDGGKAVKTVTTPSMWALADEWVDSLKAAGGHTSEWYDSKLGGAIFALAAMDLGIIPEAPLGVAPIAELLNAYDVDMVSGDEQGENPTPTDPEGGPAPE